MPIIVDSILYFRYVSIPAYCTAQNDRPLYRQNPIISTVSIYINIRNIQSNSPTTYDILFIPPI